ncbi:hypothetical protein FQR65_LT06253 [Abscondita terminalis]|nr:hypothetical protein FQR65_LT06253 [Abscondita terminalis]
MASTSASTHVKIKETETRHVSAILHHKCNVIKLVRQQIEDVSKCEVDKLECNELESQNARPNMRNLILAAVFTLMTMWMAFMYGAFTGASICAGGPSKTTVCTSSGDSGLFIPGFMSMTKFPNVY